MSAEEKPPLMGCTFLVVFGIILLFLLGIGIYIAWRYFTMPR
jgi:hypothetical protein